MAAKATIPSARVIIRTTISGRGLQVKVLHVRRRCADVALAIRSRSARSIHRAANYSATSRQIRGKSAQDRTEAPGDPPRRLNQGIALRPPVSSDAERLGGAVGRQELAEGVLKAASPGSAVVPAKRGESWREVG
jgi:hypothetical protein